jgi:7-carboxy-7-deazaguanine synthase
MMRVNTIYQTIQGEGVKTGVPMVLLRLQGCSVGCPWCDTKETWSVGTGVPVPLDALPSGKSEVYAVAYEADIVRHICARWVTKWVLVTGGEPAEQDLAPLVAALHGAGRMVAIETSGTARGHIGSAADWVCVSPKLFMPGGRPVLPEVVEAAHEIKYVVGTRKDIARLDDLLSGLNLRKDVSICLQPVSRSPAATALCVETVQERGWRLSIQTHYLIGVP